MIISNSINQMYEEMKSWRQDLHKIPEIGLEEYETSKYLKGKLDEFKIDYKAGYSNTGIVAWVKGSKGNSDRSIALRADFDALPMPEKNEFEHKSTNKGMMHACGHDGHTSMLLGAAKYLSENNDFDGTVYFIFQPDEEKTQGAQAMIDDGLFTKFNIDEVFAFHNLPGMKTGSFASRAGTITASESLFKIELWGQGGHSALPHMGVDTITVGSQIINSLQSIVSRKLNPAVNGVVSVTGFSADGTENVLPGYALITGDSRSLSPESNKIIESSMKDIVEGIAKAHNIKSSFSYYTRTNMTTNTADQVDAAMAAARTVVGKDMVDGNCEPKLFSEDFSQMTMVKPGCYILIGNGTEGAHGQSLHSSNYDFNDELLLSLIHI